MPVVIADRDPALVTAVGHTIGDVQSVSEQTGTVQHRIAVPCIQQVLRNMVRIVVAEQDFQPATVQRRHAHRSRGVHQLVGPIGPQARQRFELQGSRGR